MAPARADQRKAGKRQRVRSVDLAALYQSRSRFVVITCVTFHNLLLG
jgi:hypothetical protein